MDLAAKARAGYEWVIERVRALAPGPQRTELLGLLEGHQAELLPMYEEALGAAIEKRRAARAAAPAPASEPTAPAVAPPDQWSVRDRTAANVAAVQVLASAEAAGRPLTERERTVVLGYSGWGGLSIEKNAADLPAGWVPDSQALIHEYYTPTPVARAAAEAIRPMLPALAHDDGTIHALEPSAGIGRFIHAFEVQPQVKWQAVEMSPISAKILAAVRPDVQVSNMPFEEWMARRAAAPTIELVMGNPPYGERGPSVVLDPDRTYRKGLLGRKAYLYFLFRALDLLAPGGIGVMLVPYGFLTGGPTYRELRQQLLLRHHLMAAYRLPSGIFPGAQLVTDLLFFRSRGGAMAEIAAEDQPLVEGRYFELYPAHVLGKEVGRGGDEDDTTKKPRWGYQVEGAFTGLPPLVEREMCASCLITAHRPKVQRSEPAPVQDSTDSYEKALGARVAAYLALVAQEEEESLLRAQSLHSELRQALRDFAAADNPIENLALRRAAMENGALQALLSAYRRVEGRVEFVPALEAPPRYRPRYAGSASDIAAQALFLHQTQRRATLQGLVDWHHNMRGRANRAQIRAALVAAGWCFEVLGQSPLVERIVPGDEYYSGSLWPKWETAKRLGDGGDAQQAAQAARLMERIGPVSALDTSAEPRMGWIPIEVLSRWAQAFMELRLAQSVEVVRKDGLVQLSSTTYDYFSGPAKDFSGAERKLRILLGYLNHDIQLFKPDDVQKKWNSDADPPREETQSEALDRARREYGERARRHFGEYLEQHEAEMRLVTEAYNRTFRGFVHPTYSGAPLPIARWRRSTPSRPARQLHDYQRSAVRRLVQNRGGLAALDTGLGKSYTGCAVLALAREQGWARRPVVVVPNTIVTKWLRDFAEVLPDYRVAVIGATTRTLTRGERKGETVWDTDTAEERALKWRRFQAGEFDAVLLTYSMLDRTQLRPDSLRPLVEESSAVKRQLAMDARNLLDSLESSARDATLEEQDSDSEEQKEKKRKKREERASLRRQIQGLDPSERNRAILQAAQLRFIAEKTEPAGDAKPDPGIFWEDLGVDFLMVDEAQNFKNLYSAEAREGGTPQFLGAGGEGSSRAWQMFFRTALVRKKTGGAGVVLLSATPAKNSPLELYTMLSYIDGQAFARYGITDPEMFIDRYLDMEVRLVQGTDLEIKPRLVVRGFKRLDELREMIYRYAEFKSADEVGLKIPEPRVERVDVPMNAEQDAKYEQLLEDYREALRSMHGEAASAARFKILKLQTRMAMVALHPALDTPPRGEDKNGKRQPWLWEEWDQVDDMHAPKLDACVQRVLQRRECGHIIFSDSVIVHRWLRELLIEAGISADRIGMLNAHAAPKPEARQRVAERFNAGEFDIVIANQVAYEGIDLQVRTCRIHHLDLPWEPATLQQRNGRGVRQGNELAVVEIFYYLTQRSMDLARYQLITGKRGWMITLLKSLDRETNNPGAQAEMSPEDLLVYLSRNPDETRALIEAQRQRKLEAARQATIKESWRNLRALHLRRVEARRERDPGKRALFEREIENIATNLRHVDAEVWPWGFLAESGRGFLFAENGEPGCLPEEGSYLVTRGADQPDAQQSFLLGRIAPFEGAPAIGLRRFGSAVWEAVRLAEVKGIFDGTQPDGWRRPWPEAADHAAIDYTMQRMLDDVQLEGGRAFARLHLGLASERWRTWFWGIYGARLVQALSRVRYASHEVRVPVVLGGRLQVGRGETLIQAEILPFTEAGYRRFVELAPDSGLELDTLTQVLKWWWNATPPRGLLTPRVAVAAPARVVPQTQTEEEQAAQAEAALSEGISAMRRPIAPPQPAPPPGRSAPAAPPPQAPLPDIRGTLLEVDEAPEVGHPTAIDPNDTRFSQLEVDEAPEVGHPEPDLGSRFSNLDLDDVTA